VRVPSSKTAEEKKRKVLELLISGGIAKLEDLPYDLLGLPVYEAFLERSWALRHDDPNQMVELARFAVFLADRLHKSGLNAKEAEDLRCRAWAELANAYRVADDLERAEGALNRAADLLVLGTQNERLRARFFDILASFFADCRSFDLAGISLDLVADLYSLQGDEHLTGRAFISKGIYLGYQGQLVEAVRWLQKGLALVSENRDSGVVASALQAQSRFLADSGRYHEARLALWTLKKRNLHTEGRISALKLRWLEGHIHSGLEELDLAEMALAEVKQGFEEAGLGYKAALAGLELGAVWLRQGLFQEAERIVSECAAVFLSLQIRRELQASILVLQRAVEVRNLNLTALQHAIGVLHKAERDPRALTPEEP
jgi:tetratricopeptide (TPR) repeat protein